MTVLEPMAMCSSWERFTKKVEGSKGVEHTVTHERQLNGDYEYGFSCTCPSFKFRKGECKHIKEIKGDVCLWHQQFDGDHSDAEGKCPKCGEAAIGIICAV